MKTTIEPLDDRQLNLIIEIDEDEAQEAMRRAARQIAGQVEIPGFRKGKAPYELIVERYGEETVRKEAAELLIEEVYGEALDQEKIEPFAPGELDDVSLDPMSFEFTVPLHPTVDLGKYRDYRLKMPKVKVSKKEIKEALERVREDSAILELVERSAAIGDGIVVDLVAHTSDGTEVLRGDDFRMFLEPKEPSPAPGFSEAVVGMEAGEERTFTLPLGDDFPQEALRGQEAEFTVKLMEVYDSTLPALDDDLARTVGSFDSLQELKDQLKEQLLQAARETAEIEHSEKVLEHILEKAEVEYPPIMLEKEIDEVIEEFARSVKRQARLSLEDYLRLQDKSLEELRGEMEPHAVEQLKRALVLGEVVKLEGLEIGEAELGAQIEAISAPWGVKAEEVRASLKSDAGRQAVEGRLLGNKAVQRLVAIAKGEAPEPGAAEMQADEKTED